MLYYSVTAASVKGSRKYMEDRMCLKHIRDDQGNNNGIFLAVLDGHGGHQASEHVRRALWTTMSNMEGFSSTEDSEVLEAMRRGFITIHEQMKEFRDSWPLRANGYPSSAGTTCSCLLLRGNKVFTAHCGDSRIVLITEGDNKECQAKDLTHDHKPDDVKERLRIQKDGGRVGFTPVARVVWTRELNSFTVNNNNIEKQVESIPFLAISRSLGDFWSFVPATNKYAVSPEPDLSVRTIDPKVDKYLVLVSDGITNVMSSTRIAGHLDEWRTGMVRNMSRYILKSAIEAWRNLKADNMSVICVGLHQLDGDQQFTPFCDLDIHNEIEDRLTVFPREIILVYPQKISVAIPEWDDSIDVQNNEDDEVEEEVYSGPGHVSRQELPQEKKINTCISPIESRIFNFVRSPRFRARLHTQPLDRRQILLRRSMIRSRLNSSSLVRRPSSPFVSPIKTWHQRFGYFIPYATANRRRSRTPDYIGNKDNDDIICQSWPLYSKQQKSVAAMAANKTKSNPQVKWLHLEPERITLTEELISEEESRNPHFTFKRKQSENDETKTKRQNCKI